MGSLGDRIGRWRVLLVVLPHSVIVLGPAVQAVGSAAQGAQAGLTRSGGRGHCSPRLPRIPLCGDPHKRLYVQRTIMLKMRSACRDLPAERDFGW